MQRFMDLLAAPDTSNDNVRGTASQTGLLPWNDKTTAMTVARLYA